MASSGEKHFKFEVFFTAFNSNQDFLLVQEAF